MEFLNATCGCSQHNIIPRPYLIFFNENSNLVWSQKDISSNICWASHKTLLLFIISSWYLLCTKCWFNTTIYIAQRVHFIKINSWVYSKNYWFCTIFRTDVFRCVLSQGCERRAIFFIVYKVEVFQFSPWGP